jgi:hypothetical protein
VPAWPSVSHAMVLHLYKFSSLADLHKLLPSIFSFPSQP